MQHRRASLALLAALALAVGGCTTSEEDETGDDASASASADANQGGPDGSADGSTSPGGEGAVGVNDPSATVEWGSQSQTFLLAVCDAAGPSSLEASGNNLTAGSIMTLRATDGAGQILIESNTTQEEEFSGEFTSFSYSAGTFEGSGTYEASEGTAAFTVRGDCKDL